MWVCGEKNGSALSISSMRVGDADMITDHVSEERRLQVVRCAEHGFSPRLDAWGYNMFVWSVNADGTLTLDPAFMIKLKLRAADYKCVAR